MTDAITYVVLYAALSKASNDPEQESIASQLAAIKAKLETSYPGGYEIVGIFSDDGASGSKRNRGPDLQAAIDAAVKTAAEHDDCHLWANTSARFGRGSSRPNEARALGELFYEMRRQGVTLRTVADDDLVTNEMLIGFASKQASKYADDLSESVRRARTRAFDNGEFMGGTPRDGYRIQHLADEQGRPAGREIVFDAPRADVWRHIFGLAREGVEDGKIARRVNKEGHRTKSGRYFDRRAVADGLTCAFYAGRLVRFAGTDDEQVVDGKHPALIPPADFDALQLRRRRRREDRPPTGGRRRGAGPPPRNHALANLAVCGVCGARMRAQTSTYVRKDGTRLRYYQCGNQLSGAGCTASVVSAEVVDAEIVAELDRLLIDFDAWQKQIETGQSDERDRLRVELERAERDHGDQEKRHGLVQRRWADYVAAGDDAKADLVIEAVERERDALVQAERRLTATRDALDSIPEQVDNDALLDFGNALQAAVRGRLDDANGSMEAVNAGLCEVFDAFVLTNGSWWGTEGDAVIWDHPTRRGVTVAPVVRLEIAQSLGDAELPWVIGASDDPPPLRWLTLPPDGGPRSAAEPTLSTIPSSPTPRGRRSRGTRDPARAASAPSAPAASVAAAPRRCGRGARSARPAPAGCHRARCRRPRRRTRAEGGRAPARPAPGTPRGG